MWNSLIFYPDGWTSGNILPTYKNKEIATAENYGPISILSCFVKLFTAILNHSSSIKKQTTKNDTLDPGQ